MSLDIKISTVGVSDLPRLAEIEVKAREKNPLDRAKFPAENDWPFEKRLEQRTRRLQVDYHRSTSYYLKATIPSSPASSAQGKETIVGYVVWTDPNNPQYHQHEAKPPLDRSQSNKAISTSTSNPAARAGTGGGGGLMSREEYLENADLELWRSMGSEHGRAEKDAVALFKSHKQSLGGSGEDDGGDDSETEEEKGMYWYLSGIVVDPEYQGKGVGTALLKWGLERADKDKLPIFCLSSDEGWQLYSRNGFKEMYPVEFVTGKGEVVKERAITRQI